MNDITTKIVSMLETLPTDQDRKPAVLDIAGAVGLTGVLHLDDDLYVKDIRPDRLLDYLVEAVDEYFEMNG